MQPIIRIEKLGKQYRIGARQAAYQTLRESFMETMKSPWRWLRGVKATEDNTIWALKEINFEVRPGEVVGIIGRNSAGKSTLLKILSRITEPTTGQVDLYGRVGSLLEIGTGFHAELTGRENTFLSGAILGMGRQHIRRKLDEIVEFGGMAKFLDTPVKHYSSGMYMRLAFAVAAHLDTDILLVDEVLAVGDTEFQKKCLGKIGEVSCQGRTVLLVSHQLSAVKALCSRAIVLNKGKIEFDGESDAAVKHYLQETGEQHLSEHVWQDPTTQPGNSLFRLCAMRVLHPSGEFRSTHRSSEQVVIELEFELSALDRRLCVGFRLLRQNGVIVFQSCQTDGVESDWPALVVGRNRLRCVIPAGLLNFGRYYVAPMAYLHSVDWVLIGNPEAAFDVCLDHGVSPLWGNVVPWHFPGVIAPCLQWEAK